MLLSLIVSAALAASPIPIIFDTDMGNDVDDALALGVIHALQDRGECELIAVTITKDEPLSAPYVDLVNTFYGRGGVPIGVMKGGVTPEPSKFTVLANEKNGDAQRYPHDLVSGNDAPDAVAVLRQALAAQADRSVVIAQVGFSTNLARLLDSGTDAASPLTGMELATIKVRMLSVMAGAFAPIDGKTHLEYNVVLDIPAAQKLAKDWPTPIIWSGFEIGLAIPYPAASIDHDFGYVKHHPLQEAYQLYTPTPHERPTWDLTSVLWVLRPDRGYFALSPKGTVTVDDRGETTFSEDPNGRHQYLIADAVQRAVVRETLATLASQPPQK
ncbi:MAG: nucleoside hydrolase [Candidatus Hydrogenedentes bacterium]|nr:nucleoside hydrolase [Candidatus Hydrogenedentota bacterium]